jgi:hypothetical protein
MSLVCRTVLFSHLNADLFPLARRFLYQTTWKRTFSAMSYLATSYHVKSASNTFRLFFCTEQVWNFRSAKERMEKASTRTMVRRKTSSKAIRKPRCVFHRQAQRLTNGPRLRQTPRVPLLPPKWPKCNKPPNDGKRSRNGKPRKENCR